MTGRRLGLALCTLLLAASAPPLPPVPSTPLPILSASTPEPWTVAWIAGVCSLTWKSDGTMPVTVQVGWLPGDRTVNVAWIDPGWTDSSRPRAPVLYLKPSNVRLTWATYNVLPQGIFAPKLSHLFLNQLAGATALGLQDGNSTVQEIPFPEAASTIRALRECNDNALRTWGVDPSFLTSLREVPRPIGDPKLWLSSDDYPASALRAEAEGVVVAKLTIGPNGRVADCATAVSSGDSALDAASCRILLARGQFNPAVGPEGAPVEAPFFMRLIWTIRE